MEDLHLDDEDLSNLTDDTNFSSLLLSKSPAMLDSDGFIEDMSLPELTRLDEYIKHLEKELTFYEDDFNTIQDLRRDDVIRTSHSPSSSSLQSHNRRSRKSSMSETVASYDETDKEELIAEQNEDDDEDDTEDIDIEEELRDDEQRLKYYQQCLQSPHIMEITFSAAKAPYQTPSSLRSSRKYEQEILDTPLRVEEMLMAIYTKGYTHQQPPSHHPQQEQGSQSTGDDYDLIEHPTGPSSGKRLIRPTSFFESALVDEDGIEDELNKSSIDANNTSSILWDTTSDSLFSGFEFTPSLSQSSLSKTGESNKRMTTSSRREEFTIESLKRNWEMEDEISDAGEGEGEGEGEEDNGFILPDRSSPIIVSTFPKMQRIGEEEEDQENQLMNRLTLSRPIEDKKASVSSSARETSLSSAREAAAIATFHIPTSDTNDLRLNGDFSVWSNGKMLNPLYLHREYVGLTSSAVTHIVSGGKLIPIATAMIESGLMMNMNNNNTGMDSNKISAMISTGSSSSSSSSMTNYETVTTVLPPSSSSSSSLSANDLSGSNNSNNSTVAGNNGYYMLHTIECVIRPDIELKSVMSIIVKLAKHIKCKCILQKRSHAILFQSHTHTPLTTILDHDHKNSLANHNSSSHSPIIGKEWDQLDIQICVNRELRQRVVLMQFMKRNGIFGSSGLGLIATQLAGPLEYIPLSKCPSTKKLVSTFKKEMINQELTLSCLYTIPMEKVCALPKGLDKHFLAQLHSLCRENMLQKLTNDYKGMEEHLKEQAIQNKIFLETIEPILKQYNIPTPTPWSKKRVGTKTLEEQFKKEATIVENMSSEAIINSLQDFDRQFLTSPERKQQQQSKYQSAYFEQQRQQNENQDDGSRPEIVPSTPERSSASTRICSQEEGRLFNTPISKQHGGLILKSNQEHQEHQEQQQNHSFHTVTLYSPTSSPMLRKYRSEIESSSDENMDGMTLCLMMLDKCYQNLQSSCDSEYEQRVQQRNSSTILLIEDMITYKKEILQSILHYPDIINSPTMKSFQQTFQGLRVIKESTLLEEKKKEQAAAAAAAAAQSQSLQQAQNESSSSAKISSWFQGFGAKLQTGLGMTTSSTSSNAINTKQSQQSQQHQEQRRKSPTSSPNGSSDDGSPIGNQEKNNQILKKKEVPFRLTTSIVLYYCTGLIGNVPGVTYITQRHICFTSSVLGFNTKREVLALDHLTDISLLSGGDANNGTTDAKVANTSSSSSSGGLFASNTLKFSFYFGLKEVTITPMAIDCMKVKAMIELIQQQFSVSYDS